MNLKFFILLSSIFSFFQSVFSQEKKLKDVDVFRVNPSEVTSFEQAQQMAENIIYYLLQEKIIPGVAVTVSKDGNTVWQKGYGFSNIQRQIPIDPKTTLFRIASVSKPLSALVLARLQDKKLFDWNASLYEYVPNFPKKPFDFTIRQLGGHIAGIRNYRGNEMMLNEPLSIEQGIDLFKDDILEFAPGTKYLYSSYNWNLISLAIQKCLNKDFEKIAFEEVFEPLEMKNTFGDRGKMVKNQSVPYTRGKNGFDVSKDVNNYYKLAGGGFLSTSEDVTKMGNAILAHNFLSESVENEMLNSLCTDDEQQTGYSIGWQSSKDWNNRHYYGHIGNGIGGYAWFYVYPQEKVVITMLFNVTNPKMDIYLQRIIDFILEGTEKL